MTPKKTVSTEEDNLWRVYVNGGETGAFAKKSDAEAAAQEAAGQSPASEVYVTNPSGKKFIIAQPIEDSPEEPAPDPLLDPVADFAWSPSAPVTGQTITFTSSSSDPEGQAITEAWSFGDGSAEVLGRSVTHAYIAAGTYSVRLTVTAEDGRTATVTKQVAIATAAAPAPDPGPGIPPAGPAHPSDLTLTVIDRAADGRLRIKAEWPPVAEADHYIVTAGWNDGSPGSITPIDPAASGLTVTIPGPGGTQAWCCVRSVAATGEQSDDATCRSVNAPATPPPEEEPATPNAPPVASFVVSPTTPPTGAARHWTA